MMACGEEKRHSSSHAFGIGVVLAAIAVVASLVFHQRREDIDINSGRLRSQVKVGPIVVSESIRKTPFSKLVGAANLEPDWRHVNTKGVLGGHGRYGLAASELKRFLIVCDDATIAHQERVLLGGKLLELLRDEDFEGARKLVDGISKPRRRPTTTTTPGSSRSAPAACPTGVASKRGHHWGEQKGTSLITGQAASNGSSSWSRALRESVSLNDPSPPGHKNQ